MIQLKFRSKTNVPMSKEHKRFIRIIDREKKILNDYFVIKAKTN